MDSFFAGKIFYIGKLWRTLEIDFPVAQILRKQIIKINFSHAISDFPELLEICILHGYNFSSFHHFMMTHALESSLEPNCWIFRYESPFMKVVFLKKSFVFLNWKHLNLRPCIFRCISFACEKWWQFSSESDERFYFVRFPCEWKNKVKNCISWIRLQFISTKHYEKFHFLSRANEAIVMMFKIYVITAVFFFGYTRN